MLLTVTVPPQHHPPRSPSSVPVGESSGSARPPAASVPWSSLFLEVRK